MDPTAPRTVPRTAAVIGAGMAGLVAARRLAQAGLAVTLWEAGERVGGQVESVETTSGLHLDVGAEALHHGAPCVSALLAELGLQDTEIPATGGSSNLLTPRGLRPLPVGVGPAGPTRLGPVLRSGTLAPAALVRAGLEPLAARRMPALVEGADVSVGEFVSGRFGRQVTGTFVDPLLGNLHGGDVARLSLRACAPMLVPSAAARRSLVLRRRAGRSATVAGMVTWPRGLATLTERLLADSPGVEVRTAAAVTGLVPTEDGRYAVETASDRTTLDAVVVAVPAGVAARLLRDLAPGAAETLATTESADVATVLVSVPAAAARSHLHGTGLMVPSGTGRLLKAATYLGNKWPHLTSGHDFWIRLSTGRIGERRAQGLSDDELAAALLADLASITGLSAAPRETVVRRWPGSLPQLTVGHQQRLASVRAALPAGVVLAGASYDGLGLVSCTRSGEAAATALLGREAAA